MGLALDILYAVGLTATSPVWGFNLLRTGKWRTDWSGRLGKGEAITKQPGQKTILFHAVSVGEVNLIRQLVSYLSAADSNLNIVIASTTNTGMATAEKTYGEQHTVVRYPLDFSGAMSRFLGRIQPDLVATVELEVWPHLTAICKQRNIPVCVVNGRISDRSFPRYRQFAGLFRPSFSRLSAAAMQTQTYADRITELGAPADGVCVLDTMKWDTAEIADQIPGAQDLARNMGIATDRPVIVLGSTGDTEEKLLVDALQRNVSSQTQIIIVPRKPERFDEVARQFPGNVRRTEFGEDASRQPDEQQLFLVDTLGELRKVYSLADVVIVGRSFNRWGASDPIEPVALGKPTIIGPAYRNFREVVEAFEQSEGILVCPTPDDAATEVARLLADNEAASKLAAAGREVVRTRQGSTERHAALLMKLIEQS